MGRGYGALSTGKCIPQFYNNLYSNGISNCSGTSIKPSLSFFTESSILFHEALHRTGEMKQWEGKEIANIMNNAIVGWKPHGTHRFGKKYGIQRSWKRMEDSVKKDKDGFIEVPEQLEIPFE